MLANDEDDSEEEGSEGALVTDKDKHQLKLFQELDKIKERNKQIADEVRKAGGETLPKDKVSKREEKEIKKLQKEMDKLERDAMVARMLEKDK